jgi:hypothetical protein
MAVKAILGVVVGGGGSSSSSSSSSDIVVAKTMKIMAVATTVLTMRVSK